MPKHGLLTPLHRYLSRRRDKRSGEELRNDKTTPARQLPPPSVTGRGEQYQPTVPWQYMLPTLSAKRASNASLKILDVGCGSGSITIELAKLVPAGEVVGVDISAAVLESAKVFAERERVGNVRFERGDAEALPWADGMFDVVCTHQVIAHCRDPAVAVRELLRLTRKDGGVLCMREGDLGSGRFEEPWAVLQECFGVVVDVHAANGGCLEAGRRLKEYVLEAGASEDRIVEMTSETKYDTFEKRQEYGGHWPARCSHGAFADCAVKLGVERSRLEAYALAWKDWINTPDACFTMTHGEIIVHA